MAIRLGQALGLDGRTGRELTYEIEVRRLFWWSLSILDLQAAFDAGLHLVLASNALTDTLPMHINDTDIHPDKHVVAGSKQNKFTHMTFAAMTHAMLRSARTLTHVPADFESRPILAKDGPNDL